MKKIEITEGMNGYPQCVHTGYCDFSNYEEAEKHAQEVNGEVVLLHRKDGWNLWESKGRVFGPIERSEEDYGDNYRVFATREDYLDDRHYIRIGIVEDERMNTDELAAFDSETERIALEFRDGIGVVLCNGEYYETIELSTMSYQFDTHHFTIGVEIK